MKVVEAKRLVLDGIFRDLQLSGAPVIVDPTSPDPNDPGKFIIDGKVARVVHFYSGWHPHINLAWFSGSYDMPIRDWVLEFAAPLGNNHRDHIDWRADIRVDRGFSNEGQAYVVSYGGGGEKSHRLARAYDVNLLTVYRRRILAPAG